MSLLSYNDVSKYFHLPLLYASIELHLDLVEMKQEMKRLNIQRWPYSYKRKPKDVETQSKHFKSFKIYSSRIEKPYRIQGKILPLPFHNFYLKKVKIENLIN